MLDEKIAAIKSEYRKRTEEDLVSCYQAEVAQNHLILEEVKYRMKRGKIIFPHVILDISYDEFCEKQLRMPFPLDFFNSICEEDSFFAFINQKYQCSLVGKKNLYTKEKTGEQWKNDIFRSFVEHFVFPEYLTEYQENDREYIIYLTRMSDGVYYNISYRIFGDGFIWTGSASCKNEKRQTLGIFLEAVVGEIIIQGGEYE